MQLVVNSHTSLIPKRNYRLYFFIGGGDERGKITMNTIASWVLKKHKFHLHTSTTVIHGLSPDNEFLQGNLLHKLLFSIQII